MLAPATAPLLYKELSKIKSKEAMSVRDRILACASLIERLFFEATKEEQIAFSSLFARISYAGQRFQMEPDTIQLAQMFRWTSKKIREGKTVTAQDELLAIKATATTIEGLYKVSIPDMISAFWKDEVLTFPQTKLQRNKSAEIPLLRVVVMEDDEPNNCLIGYDEDQPGERIRIRYGIPDRNENFMPTIQIIRKAFKFPVTLHLLEVLIDEHGEYAPAVFIIEPDYLMDVSAIAECFKDTGPDPYAWLVKKFLPFENTDALLIGNIANFFLDRLLNDPDAAWIDTFKETFRNHPFTYAPMTDPAVKSISGKAQKHFLNLKNMAAQGFEKEGIAPEKCFLEPSFYSNIYGIQGRLDLFYREGEKSAIVELKSGQPFKPNNYGIARSHFTQTLLYDLLVRSVYGTKSDSVKYILYSGVDVNQLRFAPTIISEQREALQLRNQLIAIEKLLGEVEPGTEYIALFGRLRAHLGKGFMERDFGQFEMVYSALSSLEKKYFNAFTGFIAREQWLAKVGDPGSETVNGHAALWRDAFEDKNQRFSMLSHLEICENKADQADAVIIFNKTDQTNPLANFRIGDIAVLYPALSESDTVLKHQVIKGTITRLSKTQVELQLRYRQHNLKPFETSGYWCLEPDLMETGFSAMYRSLFEWASAPAARRRSVLDPVVAPVRIDPSASLSNFSPRTGTPAPGATQVYTTNPERWKSLKGFTRKLRKNQTEAEAVLWQFLRKSKLEDERFRRQHPLGGFVVDFISLKHYLVIEIDGLIHLEQQEKDQLRTEYINEMGYDVVRFTNDQVLNHTDQVLKEIGRLVSRSVHNSSPDPSSEKEGGRRGAPYVPSTPPLLFRGGVGGGVGGVILWGPPGTGKTSVMLRNMAADILQNTKDNLLLLAYTNRAVDEICEALETIGGDIREQYFRIGGKHATAEPYKAQLLSEKISAVQTRAELRAILEHHRIVVSTVASFGQSEGLLRLKKFQRLIVDEASQILEPQLIGLLTRFENYVLIGDHRQLPAVTTQSQRNTRVVDADLNAIGLTDLRDSYFERMYHRYVSQQMTDAYALLDRQGRMHADIMAFPNKWFYEGHLKTLSDDEKDMPSYQHIGLQYKIPKKSSAEAKKWASNRVLFIEVAAENALPGQKTHAGEAAKAAQMVAFFKQLYEHNGLPWQPTKSLGIITPWRAQIAQIRLSLTELGLDPDEITIDTVERYQGGARDVIIISTCVHSAMQLGNLVSLSSEGVDRKLNVALTRARQHVLLLGNEEILNKDPRYAAFIQEYLHNQKGG